MDYLFPVNQTFCFGESSYFDLEKHDSGSEDMKKIHIHYNDVGATTISTAPVEEGSYDNDEDTENYVNSERETDKDMEI